MLVLPYPSDWQHAADYVRHMDLHPLREPRAFFRELTVCTEIGMNENRRSRMKRLSADIRDRITASNCKRVYLSRGKSGVTRELANESEIAAILEDNEFVKISVSAPPSQIRKALRDADICVSMEGSHVAHAILALPERSRLVIINPGDRFVTIFADYATLVGKRISYLVPEKRENGHHLLRTDLREALTDAAP
ncbi:glycosyltransferase 61 family protein [Palleronia sp. LCG004]|uniref:glycosyltransferase 61 family protein n=1 Tax=Palleronia sp. LCG004 TaxID=3079304 RepID=UPI0029422762|nr:glycosyltransferase 61 family protein [Palleronia sp. LCG004]WOI56521.1 glycosyltransferase 61 family protein [Palleronia sp. LCG004]